MTTNNLVYLDNNATTKVDEKVLENEQIGRASCRERV